jgi:hypothetical protein
MKNRMVKIKNWLITKLDGYTRDKYLELDNLNKAINKEKEELSEKMRILTHKGKFDGIARNLLIAIGKYEDKEIINCSEENYNNIIYIAYDINSFLKFLNEEHLTGYEKRLILKIKEMESVEYKRKVNEQLTKGYYEFQNKECKKC